MTYQTARDWQPLERAVVPRTFEWEVVRVTMDQYEISRLKAEEVLRKEEEKSEYWINGLYQVQVQRFPERQVTTLNIRRRDGKAIFRDWRHFQWIKNQLVGPECERSSSTRRRAVWSTRRTSTTCSAQPIRHSASPSAGRTGTSTIRNRGS